MLFCVKKLFFCALQDLHQIYNVVTRKLTDVILIEDPDVVNAIYFIRKFKKILSESLKEEIRQPIPKASLQCLSV